MTVSIPKEDFLIHLIVIFYLGVKKRKAFKILMKKGMTPRFDDEKFNSQLFQYRLLTDGLYGSQ